MILRGVYKCDGAHIPYKIEKIFAVFFPLSSTLRVTQMALWKSIEAFKISNRQVNWDTSTWAPPFFLLSLSCLLMTCRSDFRNLCRVLISYKQVCIKAQFILDM